jgi:electron transport complex protein RnfC
LHSPVSGTIAEISEYNMPTGGTCPMVTVENDGRDTVYEKKKNENIDSLSAEKITALIKNAAISSVGGLDEPLWNRLEAMAEDGVKSLVINAVETEPYICSSQKLISENPDEVAKGLRMMLRCTGALNALIAISDDIDKAIMDDMLESARLEGVELRLVHIHQKYPSGYEYYLHEHIFGKIARKSPDEAKAGYIYAEECINVYRAAVYNFPQISRVITVAGDAVGNPQNIEVRLGTPVKTVLEHCGLIFNPERIVLGSVMRGVAITDLSTPITKQVTAVLAFASKIGNRLRPLCINCGKCVRVCPEGLMPNYIAMRAVVADIEACKSLKIDNCIECGSCAYICPGHMPLVELIKNIKKAGLYDGNSLE